MIVRFLLQSRCFLKISFFSFKGVERLSSISLRNPEHINCRESADVKSTSKDKSSDSVDNSESATDLIESGESQNFSVPSELNQQFLITPCKLRLVTLTGFILWKCKVGSFFSF